MKINFLRVHRKFDVKFPNNIHEKGLQMYFGKNIFVDSYIVFLTCMVWDKVPNVLDAWRPVVFGVFVYIEDLV